MSKEPLWIDKRDALAIHEKSIDQFGGTTGLRDAGLLESALARPQQLWAYGKGPTLFDLAAAYAYGIAKNHPFIDGNKRTAFGVMGVFLAINGYNLKASEAEATVMMIGIAAGDIEEEGMARWLKDVAAEG